MASICFGLNYELLPTVDLLDKNGKKIENKNESKESFEGYTYLYVFDYDGMAERKLVSLGKLVNKNGKYYMDMDKNKDKNKDKNNNNNNIK